MHYYIFFAVFLLFWNCVWSAQYLENAADLSGFVSSRRKIPDGNVIVGYAPHCNATQIVQAARDGVNVIIWFAINLAVTKNVKEPARPLIQNQLNVTCIAQVAETLHNEGLQTTHLVSIGGWDAPHPDTSLSGEEWFQVWQEWNTNFSQFKSNLRSMESLRKIKGKANSTNATVVGKQPEEWIWRGFDGFDWDLEGNDDASSPWNHFTIECIELVGTMSQSAKAAGFVVTLVPPQSYFDITTSEFDLSLTHAYGDYHPEFHYRGKNAYAALVAKYGKTNTSIHDTKLNIKTDHDGNIIHTFDLIMVQIYESWSRADESINGLHVPASTYLVNWITALLAKTWLVNFTAVPKLGLSSNEHVKVTAQQFVIGFSRGGFGGKSVFVWPRDVAQAWKELKILSSLSPSVIMNTTTNIAPLLPRGVMHWNINIDNGPVNNTNETCYLTKEFNEFLQVRDL